MNEHILELKKISKNFSGVQALLNVDFLLKRGEVHALIGENGAGKSTMVKILTGIYQPTAGEIVLNGEPVKMKNPRVSQSLGITAIHQEVSSFPDLTVTENIFMGHHLKKKNGLLDWKKMRLQVRNIIHSLGLNIPIDSQIKELSTAERHLVEIVKALSIEADIVIMDEPTSALSMQEVDELFAVIHKLKDDGKSIIFISHKLDELKEIADNFTVLRDGQFVGSGHMDITPVNDIIHMMVGREVNQLYPKQDVEIGEIILRVNGLSVDNVFSNISFDLARGEILGIYGLVGAGRSEVMRSIMGIDKLNTGEIVIDGQLCSIKDSRDAMNYGIGFVPEDRQQQGVAVDMSISANATLTILEKVSHGPFINHKEEYEFTDRICRKMAVKAAGWNKEVKSLSGGNQQKVVIAKWLALEPRILILDEPTKGIDVGTKSAVHRFMSELAGKGMAIIMVSSEIPEVLGMADNIIVMQEGMIVARYNRQDATSEKLVRAATGN